MTYYTFDQLTIIGQGSKFAIGRILKTHKIRLFEVWVLFVDFEI